MKTKRGKLARMLIMLGAKYSGEIDEDNRHRLLLPLSMSKAMTWYYEKWLEA